jgi:hypothetical protein
MSTTAGQQRQLGDPLEPLRATLLTALLVSTQIVVTVPNPLSLGSGKSLPLAEIPLALIAVWLVVWWVRHRDVRLDPDDRYLVVGAVVFGVVLGGVTVLRAVLQHRTAVSTTSWENVCLGIVFYFMLRRRWFTTHELVLAIHALLVVAEVTALVKVVTESTTLRLAAPLTNANMYVGLALLTLPFLLWYAVNGPSKLLLWWTLGQMATVVAFVALSGSRFGGVALVVELVVVFLLLDHRAWSARLLNVGLSAAMCLVVTGLVLVASPETSADFQRTINVGSALAGQSVPSAGEAETKPQDWAKLPRVMGADSQDWPTNPAMVDPGNPDVDVWTPERSLRPRLWPRALDVLHDHWVLGTGRPVLFYYGYGYQTPHSIVFDPLVSMGVFGALALWALLARVLLSLVREVRSSRRVGSVLLGAVVLLACSLIQPLVDSVLVLSLLYWGLFAVGLTRPPLAPTDVKAEGSRRESATAAARRRATHEAS